MRSNKNIYSASLARVRWQASFPVLQLAAGGSAGVLRKAGAGPQARTLLTLAL